MTAIRGVLAYAAAGLAACVVALAPAPAAADNAAKKRAASLAGAASLGSFTPAAADPRLAAAFARSGFGSGFRFTPSAAPGGRRAVTVAVRARAATPAEAERTAAVAPSPAITPTAYNLGVAVGWKRFTVSGDVARVDLGVLPGGREAVDIGLSYSGRQWSTRLQLAADRSLSEVSRLLGNDLGYSVDLGGSYALSRNFEVTGGVRYRLQRDRLDLTDDRRDAQAVYVGTAFKF